MSASSRSSMENAALEKGLPTNIDAERFILGSVMLDDARFIEIAGAIAQEDFALEKHRRIFQRMSELHERGEKVDRVTVANELLRFGELESVDGLSYLVSLDDGLPQISNLESYVRIVRDKATLRRIAVSAQHLMNRALAGEEDPSDILAGAEETLLKLGEARTEKGLMTPLDVIQNYAGGLNAFLDPSRRVKGVSTGFTKLDEMTGGMHGGELIILAARPAMGKCLAADSEIVIADGSIRTIGQICAARKAELLTLEDNGRLCLTSPSAFVDDGIKPVFRVTTALGRYVDSTLPHPFLTPDGWKRLEDLQPGAAIAVPHRIPVFGSERLRGGDAKLLGYLLGSSSPEFTHSDPRLRDEFSECLSALESGSRSPASHDSGTALAVQPSLKTAHILETRDAIPERIFRAVPKSIALFLNRLFAAGGWASVLPGGQAQLGFASPSERIARQVQHLLLRFGILSSLMQNAAWELEISGAESIHLFCSEIGIFGRERTLDRIRNAPRSAPAPTDLYWDRIVSIEYLGNQQVFDLTIPETHNFVANDICVHNTAFALNIAWHVATRLFQPVAIFSLEMSQESLLTRMLCAAARVDSQRFRSGYLNEQERQKLRQAANQMVEAPIYIDDTSGVHLMDMHAKLRKLQQQGQKLGLVVVDYLQLMSSKGRVENRNQEVSQLSRGLKLMSKELDCPFLVLSQLSRATETRVGDHRPQLSDLRESGSIEQDADLVGFIFREEVYKRDREDLRGLAEFILAKQRNGPVGKVDLVFLHAQTRFENRAEDLGDLPPE